CAVVFSLHFGVGSLRTLLTRLLLHGVTSTTPEGGAQLAPRTTRARSGVLTFHCSLAASRHLGHFDNRGCRLAHISHVLSETPWGFQWKGANRIPALLPHRYFENLPPAHRPPAGHSSRHHRKPVTRGRD